MKELNQRKILDYRKFKLHSTHLLVEAKEAGKLTRYKIPIEEIGFDKIYQQDKNIVAKLIWYIFIIIPFAAIGIYVSQENPPFELTTLIIICGCFWLVSLIAFLHPMQDDIILTGYRNIHFYRNKPDEATVNNFIDELIKASKEYQRNLYIDIEEDISEEEFKQRLNYLLKKEIVSKSEYDIILDTFKTKKIL